VVGVDVNQLVSGKAQRKPTKILCLPGFHNIKLPAFVRINKERD
jgi:hypothetical protein